MLTEKEKSEILKVYNEKQKLVSNLKNNLNKLNDQKEAWFKKKDANSRQIRSLIKESRESKQKRDELTKQIIDIKNKRDELNKSIRTNITEIKKLNDEKNKILKKFNIKGDPSKLKEEIDILEYKIETEALPFSKETQIMKSIKELKKKYEESQQISNVWEKAHSISKMIDKLKRDSEEIHKKIQNVAKESQQKHEQMIESSKSIKEFKSKEKEINEKINEFKKRFSETNEELKKALDEFAQIREKVEQFKQVNAKQKKANIEKKLQELEASVEEKIKKGMKITTEDFLAFQSKK